MAAKKKPAKTTANVAFVESMECLPVTTLPQGKEWSYEIKLDGFGLEAVKKKNRVTLYSRRGNVFNRKFPYLASALEELPDDTILDGEVVALDESGRSDFGLLLNFRSAESKIHYFVFDILAHKGRAVSQLPLVDRRKLLNNVLALNAHISRSPAEEGSSTKILTFAKQHGLEGVVAKRLDGVYEPGRRSGSRCKYRINLGQEFVMGGYTPGSHGFDALIVGFYQDKELFFAARGRAGFVPATRRQLFPTIKKLEVKKCPFVNFPEQSDGRWGQGLTAEKMKSCIWLKPAVVVRLDFAEWTSTGKLRHTKFIGLREDKDPRKVIRET
jgi:DNA ligase D-like protein (predicted ligase)